MIYYYVQLGAINSRSCFRVLFFLRDWYVLRLIYPTVRAYETGYSLWVLQLMVCLCVC